MSHYVIWSSSSLRLPPNAWWLSTHPKPDDPFQRAQKTGRGGGRQINEQWEMRTGIRKRWGKTTAARIPVLLLLLQVERTHRGKRFRFRFRLFDSFRYFISEGELCCTGKIAINRRGKNIIKSGCERLKNSKILTLSGLRSYTNIVDVDFQLSFMGKNGQDFL